jgi:hypothetical protein
MLGLLDALMLLFDALTMGALARFFRSILHSSVVRLRARMFWSQS